MLDGWLDQGVSKNDVAVVEPSGEIGRPGIAVSKDFAGIPAGFTPDVVVLAVKPQMMDAALPPYAGFKDAVFLSIAAGKTIAYFEKLLGDVAVVRAMPNTPAAVRRGITAVVPNAKVSPAQRQATETLLSAVGEVAWLESENLMDAVTAVSGSGPAYVFLLAEVMAQATVSGSGELLHRSSDSSAQLRQNVTSPNGTTFAALQVLMDEEGMAPLMTKAVAAATTRSKELAS